MSIDPLISALDNPLRIELLNNLTLGDLRVQELSEQTGAPMNLVSYHLKKLKEAGLVRERRSIADGRDQYYSLELRSLQDQYLALGAALHPSISIDRSCLPAVEIIDDLDPGVLFLCTHNSARSQMAETILRARSGGHIRVVSAGTHPSGVHPLAIEVLEARGYPVSSLRSKALEPFADQPFKYVITVCDRAREECPVFTGAAHSLHWSIPDPVEAGGTARERRRVFEAAADELEARIGSFLIAAQSEGE
ncbi:MAG: metalloregulator ArsR/SmtB family transcription factor [Anaerolineales bacterium]|nr:metalloregulator ArsR/SmtB family transcription factor [Anaerolineales bacterium]